MGSPSYGAVMQQLDRASYLLRYLSRRVHLQIQFDGLVLCSGGECLQQRTSARITAIVTHRSKSPLRRIAYLKRTIIVLVVVFVAHKATVNR